MSDTRLEKRNPKMLVAQLIVAGCFGFVATILANGPLIFESRLLWFIGHQLPNTIDPLLDAVPAFGMDLDDLILLLTMFITSTTIGLVATEAIYRIGTTVLNPIINKLSPDASA